MVEIATINAGVGAVTTPTWTPELDAAKSIVNDKFELVTDIVSDNLETLTNHLNNVSALLGLLETPPATVPYTYTIGGLAETTKPVNPIDGLQAPTVSFTQNVTPPGMPAFRGVRPNRDVSPPTTAFSFDENPYTSDLSSRLSVVLLDLLNAGGTGLGADVEDAIWERMKNRRAEAYATAYDDALKKNRGFAIPPGALVARLNEVNLQHARDLADDSREIAVKQADMARDQQKFIIERATALEQLLSGINDAYQARTLDAAKAVVQRAIDIHKALLDAFDAEGKLYQIDAAVWETEVKALVEAFSQEVKAAELTLTSAVESAKALNQFYSVKAEAYKAEVSWAEGQNMAKVESYKAEAQNAVNTANVALKNVENLLQNNVQYFQMRIQSWLSMTSQLSQIVASALSAVSASASVGLSASDSRAFSHSVGASLSNSLGYDESHTYNETTTGGE